MRHVTTQSTCLGDARQHACSSGHTTMVVPVHVMPQPHLLVRSSSSSNSSTGSSSTSSGSTSMSSDSSVSNSSCGTGSAVSSAVVMVMLVVQQ
jgi:hypothetical protein